MKKLILSSIALLIFALSITLFQLSCKKSAEAQSPSYVLPVATTSKLGGVIPDGSTISIDVNGKISMANNYGQQQNKILYQTYGTNGDSIWIANYDGSNAQKINIVLPGGLSIDDNDCTISPDHKTIFFGVNSAGSNSLNDDLYACGIDGSNPHKIISSGGKTVVAF